MSNLVIKSSTNSYIKKKMSKLDRRQELMAYIFIAPVLFLFIVFLVLPVVEALYLSFTKYDGINTASWIGLKNYIRVFQNDLFRTSIKNVFVYVIMFVPILVMFSLITAIALNRKKPFMGTFRTIYYLPGLTSAIGASVVWLYLLNPEYGMINQMLGYIGIAGPSWLADMNTAMLSIVIMSIWQTAGINVVIFLAGLQGIPEYLYESAIIDGAGRWNLFRHITLPGLAPTTFYIVTMALIGAFQLFDQVFALTDGGPANSTITPVYLIYDSFREMKMGYSSAMAIVLFSIILVLSLINMKVNKESSML